MKLKRNIVFKFALLSILTVLVGCFCASFGLESFGIYAEKTYGSQGVPCTNHKHTNCTIFVNHLTTGGTKNIHINRQLASDIDVKSAMGVFCLDHSNNKDTSNRSKNQYYMEIDNTNVIFKDGSSNAVSANLNKNEALKLAYILSEADGYVYSISEWKNHKSGSTQISGHWWSYAQYCLWSPYVEHYGQNPAATIKQPVHYEKQADCEKAYGYTFAKIFFRGISSSVNAPLRNLLGTLIGWWGHNFVDTGNPYNKNQRQNLITNSIALSREATYYMNDRANYQAPIFNNVGGAKVQTANIVGPFNLSYQSNTASELLINEFKLYDENGNEISRGKWSIGVYSNGAYYTTNAVNSGNDFYIWVDSSVRGISKLTAVSEVLNVKAQTALIVSADGAQKQMFVGYASRYKQKVYTELGLDLKFYGNLNIAKTDASNGASIAGIGFVVYNNSTGRYVTSNSGTEGNTPVTFYTNNEGKISIINIPIGSGTQTYKVIEVASNNVYYKATWGNTDLNIVAGGTATANITNTKAYNLTVKKQDSIKGKALRAGFCIKYEDGTWLTNDGQYSNQGAQYITVDGSKTFYGIKRGTYYIYECEAPEGYDITTQPGYDSSLKSVYIGEKKVDDNDTSPTVTADNIQYVKINGKVWLENQGQTKDSGSYNNTYDSGTDGLLSGITVELVYKPNGVVVLRATTNDKGEYQFEKVTYDYLKDYYVRFTYDKEKYVPVPVGTNANNSKAIEQNIANSDLNDTNLIGKTGYAVTTGISLSNYYNSQNFTVENINLGLMQKIPVEYDISESIAYVKVVKGNYTYTYKYGNETVVIPADPFSTVQLQNSNRTFTQKLYPSDIKYNVANNYDGTNQNAYRVYVVYKIDITNNTTFNYKYLYQEQKLYLNSLISNYDTNRYILDKNYDSENNQDFALWGSNNNGSASYNINDTHSKLKDGLEPNRTVSTYIQYRVTDDALTGLLYKSQDEINRIYSTSPTKVTVNGYHTYLRSDSAWDYNTTRQNNHTTKSLAKEAAALYLKLNLSDTRTTSGKVFEDTKVNRLDGESRQDERIGNGKYDEGENGAENVIVTLMDSSTNQVAYVYDGELAYDAGTGKWTTNKKQAVTKTNANGEWSLPGMVPGKYYIQFTYGDGTVQVTDMNGNAINEVRTKVDGKQINSNYYKSTILTGAAKNANSSNEDTWFINSINDGSSSVATDKTATYFDENGNVIDGMENVNIIEARTTSTREINNTSAKTKLVVNAQTPNMDIKFEYTENPETEHNEGNVLKTNCTGMNFGIIERAHTNIELEKVIENVKLTLSNGTTIINGNPRSNNMPVTVTSMSDSYSKIEIDSSYIYGSSLLVTYKLTAINNSELDYATENYYTKGIIDGAEPVTTAVTKLIDYNSYKNAKYEEISSNIELSDNYADEGYTKENYFEDGVQEANTKYKDQLLIKVADNELTPRAAGDENNYKTDYTITLGQLISDSDDEDFGMESYSEILALKNKTFTSQYGLISGNYKAGDTVSVNDGGTSENDNADATMSITPPTGANRSYTIYFIAGGLLALIGLGVLGIKKFVL